MTSQNKTCRQCRANYEVTESDLELYAKLNLPAPAFCPRCRFLRRAQFRNERTLYSAKCGLCQKPMISMYHPKVPYVVYCTQCFTSDKWDPGVYGMDYDPSRSFLEQLGELFLKTPKKGRLAGFGDENSDYTNVASHNKNCYLILNSAFCENSMYSRGLRECRETIDSHFAVSVERCYEVIDAFNSTNVIYSQHIDKCLDSGFLLSCSDCVNCFGCVNLRHKNFYFFNKALPEAEYRARVGNILNSFEELEKFKKEFVVFALEFPRRLNNNLKSENCSGECVSSSKDVFDSFEMDKTENCRHCYSVKKCKDSRDLVGYGYDSELLFDCVGTGYSQKVLGSINADYSHDIYYSNFVLSCADCFGCDGLNKKQYCILNKQYSETEYKRLTSRIIAELTEQGEWGLSLPPALALFGYNETIAQQFYPLTKEAALEAGFKWQDDLPEIKGRETLTWDKIPGGISEVPESVTKEILACQNCGKNFKIIAQELAFYRSFGVPLPRKCFNCRFEDRMKKV
ncbi:MAG: hypothetical protein V1821_04355, partial [bacterium]